MIRFRPRVVLAGAFNLWSAYALLVKKLMKWRVVLIWDGVSPAVACLNSPVRLTIRRIMAKAFDAAISNTHAGVRYLEEVLGMPSDKIVRHPYQVAEPAALGCGDTDDSPLPRRSFCTFLVVGRLIELKGVHRLLDAAKLLVERGVDNFVINVVGTGEMAETLRRQATDFGLDRVVQWIGFVPYDALGRHYQASDALILPSLVDVWGMVVLEAMCFGKAVLCSKHAGAREMVQDGENGFVFDPHDPRELADQMELLIRVPGLVHKLGERSKELIAPYSARRSAEVLLDVATGRLWRTAERSTGQGLEGTAQAKGVPR